MNIFTWKRGEGYTFCIEFVNGNVAEYIEKPFKTKRGAEAAGERYREQKGDNWERGNIHYDRFDRATGDKIAMFAYRNING